MFGAHCKHRTDYGIIGLKTQWRSPVISDFVDFGLLYLLHLCATVQSFFEPCPLLAMEPARKRRSSPVWEHFDLIASSKVKCLLCARELVHNNNTSSMLRHYRALHESKESHETGPSFESKDVDEALVKMVSEDCQPFTIVEDEGFRKFVTALNPTYVLPTGKALKAMVDDRYKLDKEKAKEMVSKASAVSLTADMCPKKETV